MELLDNLRYDHPRVFRSLLCAMGLLAFSTVFMSLPESSLFRTIGVTSVQQKVRAAMSGVYWSTRAFFNDNGDDEHIQLYGNVEGINEERMLVAILPSGERWEQRTFRLANLEVVDLYGTAQELGALRMENARFDVYRDTDVVVWIHNTPLNVKLIEAGVATPASKPPSNIFDLAFAAYYWRIVKNGE